MRMYGLGDSQPSGYCSRACSSDTEPAMSTSSPCFQFTGVATLCLAVSWSESTTRSTSSKLQPVVHRINEDQLDLLVGPDHEDIANRLAVCGSALGRIAGHGRRQH